MVMTMIARLMVTVSEHVIPLTTNSNDINGGYNVPFTNIIGEVQFVNATKC